MSQAARRPAQSTTSYPLARPRSAISPSSASVSRAVPLPWLTRCTGTVRLALSAMTALMASGPSTEGISTRQAEPSAKRRPEARAPRAARARPWGRSSDDRASATRSRIAPPTVVFLLCHHGHGRQALWALGSPYVILSSTSYMPITRAPGPAAPVPGAVTGHIGRRRRLHRPAQRRPGRRPVHVHQGGLGPLCQGEPVRRVEHRRVHGAGPHGEHLLLPHRPEAQPHGNVDELYLPRGR